MLYLSRLHQSDRLLHEVVLPSFIQQRPVHVSFIGVRVFSLENLEIALQLTAQVGPLYSARTDDVTYSENTIILIHSLAFTAQVTI